MAYPDELSAPAVPSEHREQAPDKRLLSGAADLNPLAPGSCAWAAEKFRSACANHWWPEDVSLARDVVQWQTGPMTVTEKGVIRYSLVMLAATGRAASRVAIGLHRLITPPQCRQFLLRQAFEESLHLHACQYMVTSFGFDADAIDRDAGKHPAMAAREAYAQEQIEPVLHRDFHTGTAAADQKLLKALVLYACLREGLAFHTGCVWIQGFGRQKRLVGMARLYQYILRDEELHCRFMMDLVNQIRMENPHLWTPAFREELRDLLRRGVELDIACADSIQSQIAAGLHPGLIGNYLRCLADRRLQQIGLEPLYAGTPDPFPWMMGMADLPAIASSEPPRAAVRQFGGLLSWE